MKKNVMMRAASVMLVLVLLTSSVISGTFAKYVSAGNATDNARVAKWGVEFNNTSDLFKTEYTYDDTSNKHSASWLYSVKSKNGENVVAPGTAGNVYNLTTTGNPEVSYIVTFDVDETTLETIFLNEDEAGNVVNYYPIEFTLKIGANNIAIADGQAASLAAAIEGAAYFYEVTTEHYYCRTTATGEWIDCGTTAPVLNLSWLWDFEQGTDNLDTMLGNLVADKATYEAQYTNLAADDYNLEVAVTVNATATQID